MIQAVRLSNYVGVAPGTTTMYLPSPTAADMHGHAGLGLIEPGAYTHTGDVGRVYANGRAQGIPTQAPLTPLSRNWTTATGAPLPPKSGVQLDGANLGYVSTAWWQTGRPGNFNYPSNVQPLSGAGLGFIPGMEYGGWNRSLSGTGVFVESKQAPNDAELSRVYGYTPVNAGWLYADKLSGADEDAAKALTLQERSHKARVVGNVLIAFSTVVTLAIWFQERKRCRTR